MVSSKIFAQLLFSSVALAGSLDLRQAGTKVSNRRKTQQHIHKPPKKTPKKLTSSSLFFSPPKQQCDSDDACKTPCRTPNIQAQGVNVTPSEKIQEEARRRFGDAHCENKRCACAVSGRRRKIRRRRKRRGDIMSVMNVTDCFRCSSRVMIKHKISANFG